MKKQRVTTLCLCLILLFTLSLCGCQKPQSTPTKTDTPVTETSSQTEPIGNEGAETVLYQQFVNQLNDPDDCEDKVYQENQHLQAEAKDVVENDGDVPWLIIP